jgi:DNA invertase Pin-like site-specific DNA recombinase
MSAKVPIMKTAAVYVRVSREYQVEGESLDAQVAECMRAAAAEEYEVPARLVFREEGITGVASSRPALDTLTRAASSGEFNRLYVWKVSRFGRSARNNLNLLEDLKEQGVSVRFVQDGLDTSQRMAGLLFALLSSLAELERENIAEQTMLGKRASASNGRWQGGVPPYGLRAVDSPEGRGKVLELDPEEAALLHEMRRWVVEDQATTYQIAQRLNARGVRPRWAHSWSRQLVSGILRNPRLKGEATYSGSPYPMPAVFTDGQYEDLQVTLLRRSSPRRPNTGPYLFTGFLRCGCGTHFVGHRSRGKRAYRCRRNDTGLTLEERCDWKKVRWLQAEPLETEVWGALVDFLTDPDRLATIIAAASAPNGGSETEATLRAVRKRTAELEQARRRITVDYAISGVDPGTLRDALADLDEELAATRRELKRLEAAAQQRQLRVEPEQLRTHARQMKATLLGMSDVAKCREVLAALNLTIDIVDRRSFAVAGSLPLDGGKSVQPGTTSPGPGSPSPVGPGRCSRWRPGPHEPVPWLPVRRCRGGLPDRRPAYRSQRAPPPLRAGAPPRPGRQSSPTRTCRRR